VGDWYTWQNLVDRQSFPRGVATSAFMSSGWQTDLIFHPPLTNWDISTETVENSSEAE
jgi:hypothetical protein